MIDFLQNLQTEEHNFQEAFVSKRHAKVKTTQIPTSKEITGIEVRLSDVVIIDNKTPKVFPFPGLAKVYFINMILSDVSTTPITIDLNGFEKVDDNYKLSLDRTLFSWKQKTNSTAEGPSQIHVFSSLIKSKQSLRDVAKVMADVKADKKFQGLADELATLLKKAGTVTNISSLVFELAGIVGGFLGKVEDKPLLTWVQSFTDLNGDFDVLGKTAKSAENKFASMKLTITIRDKGKN